MPSLIFAAMFPLLTGALVAWTTRSRGPNVPTRSRWVVLTQITALALGWGVSQGTLFGAVRYPIISSDGLLRVQALLVLVLAMVGGAVLIWKKRDDRVTPVVVLAALLGAVSVVVTLWLRMRSAGASGQSEHIVAIFAGAAAGALLTWPIAKMAAEGRRVTSAAVLAGIIAASAAGLLGTGSESLARMTAGLALVCVGMLATIVFVRSASVALITIAAACGGLIGPMTAGVFFSSTPLWLIALLAAAPMCGYLAGRLVGEKGGPVLGAVIRIGVPAGIAAAGIAPGLLERVALAP